MPPAAGLPTVLTRVPRPWMKRIGPTAVVALTALALIATAAFVPGTPITDLRLNDGAVYVTKSSAQLVGKFNPQIDALAASVQTVNSDFDIEQNENRLLLADRSAHQLQRIDPVTQTTGTPTKLPDKAAVSLGGDTVTVTAPDTGATWARSFDAAFGVDYAHAKPDLTLGRDGVAVAGPDGRLRAVSITKRTLYVQQPDGSRSTTRIPFTVGTDVQLSVVAGTAVLLDPAAGVVWVAGHDPVQLPDAAHARLQAPSAEAPTAEGHAADAVVATGAGLVAIDDDQARVIAPADGAPSQPVVVAGCAYGAWAGGGKGTVIRACTGQQPVTTPIRSVPADANLVFRVNRDHVVLNDAVGGNIWLVTQDSRLISGWDKVTPPEPDQGNSTQNSKTTAKIDPNRSQANRPPVAVDDTVSARAGRTTELPLLDNDSDPDGDILTFTKTTDPGQGTLARIRGGAGLQITLPPDASGRVTFQYTISDGRGGTASASVRLNILPSDPQQQDRPPRLFRTEPIVTTLGQTVTRHILHNWRDPDGDPMVLTDATVKGDDEVRFQPDGSLTYLDAGTKSGRKLITVTVSDGTKKTTEQIPVTVRRSGTVPPQANGDFVTTRAGEPVVVHPLDNDTGNDIYLTRVDSAVSGAEIDTDYDHNAFTFTAAKPGSYYVGYIVSNGPTAFGLVRIDVSAPTDENRPPAAAPDTALLPAGGTVLIDPLANDEDPDNDVLVIQSIDKTEGLRIDLIQRHLVQISAVTTPEEPVQVTYTISDGFDSATGTITVIPIISHSSPDPRAEPDEATVRAGDTVTVPVLDNDTSPLGLELSVDKLAEKPDAGAAWVDQDKIRFTAPRRAGDYTAVYQVVDSEGNVASAQVKFYVTSADSSNNPPSPDTVTARVLAGSDTRILIPLRGIDPDGDTVRLLGLDTGPQLGRISALGNGYLQYYAYPSSAGTDTFRYAVVDALGARATGTIRVGVVPRADGNSPPTVVDDTVTARPGRTVRVPVLDNDSDPDADPFGFASHPLNFPKAVNAHLVDNTIQLRVPTKPGTTVGQYTVVDRRGAEASGQVRITSDPKAPLLAPVLTDDQVTAADVEGKDVVDVPVLNNDFDPDGNIDNATVSLPKVGPSASTKPGADAPAVVGQKVRVHITEALQVIRYQVTDPDGNVAWALILVPGRADAVPALRGAIKPQKVKAGESLRLDINTFVIGTQGRKVQLTTEDRIYASNGTGSAIDPHTLRFDAPADYVGPAAIEFEVTDGRSADDPDGHTAVLTIPITVLPNDKPKDLDKHDKDNKKPENRPPTFSDLTMTIGAGEPARSVSLRGAADDPDGDDLTFTKPTGRVPTGVTVGFANGRLTAKADASVEPGTSFTLTGKVSDGTASVATHVTIEVTESTRPLAVAADDVVPDAVQGKQRTVHVLANDINPFPGTPLKVVSTVVESGKVHDQAVVDGGRAVSVTPAAHFVGTLVIRYTVQDATGASDRQVEGRIRLTVRGAPGRPGTPRRVDVGDRRAVITWTAPPDNGADITGYTVKGTGSDGSHVTHDCSTTTCTLSKLTNDVTYRFTVTATNAIGTSKASARSAGIRPDVRPGRPGKPQTKFGDHLITLKWAASKTKGSDVTHYIVELSGPQGIQRRTIGPQTHYVWEGLQNGSAYTFRIRARNKAPKPSDFSARSKSTVPAGKPSAPRSVRGTDSGGNLGRQVRVRWKAPAKNNGDKIRSYRVFANGRRMKTVDGGTHAVTLRLTNGTTYRFTVVAVNKAGASPHSRTSAAVTPYGAPSRPHRPKLTPHSHSVTIRFSGAKPNGKRITRYQARLNGGSVFRVTNGQKRAGLRNGTSYYVQVRACSSTKCSRWSKRSAAVVPYGVPAKPNPSATHVGGVRYRFHWSYPARSNGARITKLQIRTRVGGSWSGWKTKSRSGSVTLGTRGNQRLEVRVRVTNSHGDRRKGSVSRNTPAPRVRSFAGPWDKSASADSSNCPSGECFEVHAEVSNFPRLTKVTCIDHKYRIRKASKRTSGTGHISDVGRMGSLGQHLNDYRVTCKGGGVTVTSPNPPSWPKHH